jgi:membrane protein DedA with SNARE-associated domain
MDFLAALFDPDQIEALIHTFGYFAIFGLLFACGLGLPLPEDIPLLVGGFFVGKGELHLVIVSILAWCGIIGGDCVLYMIAKKYGLNITKIRFIGRHVTRERILKAEALFEKYGIWIVAVGRLFAGIRGAMVIAAGATRYNFIKFIIADGLAALVSGGMFIGIGFWAGRKFGNKRISEIRVMIKPYEHWVLLGIVVGLLLFILYAWWRGKRHTTLADVALEKAEQATQPKTDQSSVPSPGNRGEG